MKLEVNFVMDYHVKKTPCTTHLIILIDSVNESDNIITLKRFWINVNIIQDYIQN